MTQIIPTDRPVFWSVVVDDAVALSGATPVGDITATRHTVIQADSENDYLSELGSVAASLPALPAAGAWIEAGELYQWGEQAVMVRQSHTRTEHDPADVPALFCVYRPDAAEVLPWVAGEPVDVGMRRTFEGITYTCLQAHVTQADWTPPAVPALWAVVPAASSDWQPGTWYDVGVVVTYEGAEYECRQAHTSQVGWEPPNVPALWLAL